MRVATRKRARAEAPAAPLVDGRARRVFVNVIDEPERLVEVNLAVLADFNTRLYNVVVHDPPDVHRDGREFWHSDMLLAELKSYLRSLAMGGRFFAGEGVTHEQMLILYDHENLSLGNGGPLAAGLYAPVAAAGVRARSPVAELEQACELVGAALCGWNRIHQCMDAAVYRPAPGEAPLDVSCDPTRAYVCFAPHPIDDEQASAARLAVRWPRFISKTVAWIGMMHFRLARDGRLDAAARDEGAFRVLASAVDNDPLGALFGCRFDRRRARCAGRESGDEEAGAAHAAAFASEMRHALGGGAQRQPEFAVERDPLDAPERTDSPEHRARLLQFANAILTWSEILAMSPPPFARMFAGACADEQGRTFARKALAKALKRRGIAVLSWTDDGADRVRPLAFPPHFARHARRASPVGPIALLSFEGQRCRE